MEFSPGDKVVLEVSRDIGTVLAGPFKSNLSSVFKNEEISVYAVEDDKGFVFTAQVAARADTRLEALARALHASDVEELITSKSWDDIETCGYYETAQRVLKALDARAGTVTDFEGDVWCRRLDWVFTCGDDPLRTTLSAESLAKRFGPIEEGNPRG